MRRLDGDKVTRVASWRRPGAAVIVAALLIAGYAPAAAGRVSAGPQSAPFRSAIDLVTLHVTVTDRDGNHVAGLARDEFVIYEDGRRQTVRVFEEPGRPLALAVLIDGSVSVRPAFAAIQEAALSVIRQLRPGDVAAVIAFDDVVRIEQTFTSDRTALEAAVGRTTATGDTALYDALYVALTELNRPDTDHEDVPRRRVAVVLSDGDDTSSLVTVQDVLNVAARGDVALYAIRLGHADATSDSAGEADNGLEQLARQTGGRATVSTAPHQWRRAVEELRTELARQYALAYVPSKPLTDGRFRALSVQVTRPGTQAIARRGYLAARSR
jgi:Ca-activated chloride channel homolog